MVPLEHEYKLMGMAPYADEKRADEVCRKLKALFTFDGASAYAAKTWGFQDALFRMSWEEPSHRRLLELEGLRQWLPPRESNYESLRTALDEIGGW